MGTMAMSSFLDGAFYFSEENIRLFSAAEVERLEKNARELEEDGPRIHRAISDHVYALIGGVNAENVEAEKALVEPPKADSSWRRVPASVDVKGVWFCSAAYLWLLVFGCFTQPVLELRTMYSGVAVDRSVHPLQQIFIRFLPTHGTFMVAVPLFLLNVLIPLLYIVASLAFSLTFCNNVEPVTDRPDNGIVTKTAWMKRWCWYADSLRPWATMDVFVFASVVFLFTVQDPGTLTMPVEGSWAYYAFLGVGASLFYLRWFSEGATDFCKISFLPPPRFFGVFFVCIFACFYISGGFGRLGGEKGSSVPGAPHHDVFDGLDSVCGDVTPLLSKTLRSALPHSYGDCSNNDHAPPKPCVGDGPLYSTGSDNNFLKAIWLGGINTINLGYCKLWKGQRDAYTNTTMYHLHLGGRFDRIRMYLDVNECDKIPMLGCTKIQDADHCCGDNIPWNISFDLLCDPSVPKDMFQEIDLKSCSLGIVGVGASFMGGSFEISEFDISPVLEKVITTKLGHVLRTLKIDWAGNKYTIPQLINHLVLYNSPDSAGQC